jgi:hypothetical protein
MNAFFAIQSRPNATRANANVVPLPVRHIHRERDFGVGYGNSSGYASTRRYAQDWMQPRFRCA